MDNFSFRHYSWQIAIGLFLLIMAGLSFILAWGLRVFGDLNLIPLVEGVIILIVGFTFITIGIVNKIRL